MRHDSSPYNDAEYIVLLPLYTHTKKKKKIALVIRGCLRNEEERYIWYESGFDPRLGNAIALVDMI
jgi:hypothetical protein